MSCAVATIFSSLDFLCSSISTARLSRFMAATFSSLSLNSSSVSTAYLSCSLSTIFSSLRFLSNSLSTPRCSLLRVARLCFFFLFFLFSYFCILSSVFLSYSSVSEVSFAVSFSFLSEKIFCVHIKAALAYEYVVTARFLPPTTDFEHARTLFRLRMLDTTDIQEKWFPLKG